MKIDDVLKKRNISMVSKTSAPTKLQAKNFSKPGTTHWTCTFRFGHKSSPGFRLMQVKYSQGSAIETPPKACCVMNCLVFSDYVSDYISFEEWCGDFGYDTDSRDNEALFKVCQKQSRELDAFLGNDVLVELQNCEPE